MSAVRWLIVAAVMWPLLAYAAALLTAAVIAAADRADQHPTPHHPDHLTGDTR